MLDCFNYIECVGHAVLAFTDMLTGYFVCTGDLRVTIHLSIEL